jgi:hypothetical protein
MPTNYARATRPAPSQNLQKSFIKALADFEQRQRSGSRGAKARKPIARSLSVRSGGGTPLSISGATPALERRSAKRLQCPAGRQRSGCEPVARAQTDWGWKQRLLRPGLRRPGRTDVRACSEAGHLVRKNAQGGMW